MKHCKRLATVVLSIIICFVSLLSISQSRIYAAQKRENVKVCIDGREYTVRGLNHDYNNNLYLSMKDMAVAFANTSKAFETAWDTDDGTPVFIMRSIEAGSKEFEAAYDEDETDEIVKYTRKRIFVEVDGSRYSLYVIPVGNGDDKDCYVNLGEFALVMDIDIEVTDGTVYINPGNQFDFDKYDLEKSGIAYMADSCIIGDATTGEIYYASNADEVVAIASTTKLMTYLLVREAMDNGEISSADRVVFSKEADKLSKTADGVITITQGESADINDVIKGMLIVSSNECALALAQHTCKSEEEFVKRMNERAATLELSDSVRFYNPHGLPAYLDDTLTVKQSNHMTAEDMFKLSSYILEKYPDITEITSIKKTTLASLGNYKAQNTNSLLYNVPGTVGLKTGTTDKASSCLVSAYEGCDAKGKTHYILSVVYGAENYQTQSYMSMVMMRYGISRFNEAELGIVPVKTGEEAVPDNLKDLVKAVVNAARRNRRN